MRDLKIQKAFQKSKRVTIDTGETLTEQAHKNETDMNYILKEYRKTGLIRHAKENQGKYDDISVQDFQDAMFIVTEANNMFNELPGDMRKRFRNDPAAFLDFVQNSQNQAEMARMGILKGNDGVDMRGAPSGAPVKPEAPETPSAKQEPAPAGDKSP